VDYRYPLPPALIAKAAQLEEFANGGTQCHVRLADGTVYGGVLLSNASAIAALRGHSELPFGVSAITELFQADDDAAPRERGGWLFFDKWST
jgi:hypothetical protein